MTTYFTKCKVCKKRVKTYIDYGDLPGDRDVVVKDFINVYLGRTLKGTYCSEKCLKRDFRKKRIVKKKVVKKRFLWFKWVKVYRKVSYRWLNKRNPKKKFKVVF